MDDQDEQTIKIVGNHLGLSTERIREPFNNLTESEKNVLRLRFGIDSVKVRTAREIGENFEGTRERIRQIEAKALRKLRNPNRAKLLKSFYG
jgi:RNA polymerase primary sigma factor